MLHEINSLPSVWIRQRKEMAELFGFETRNKYSIETEDGRQIGFAAEQQKGVLGFFLRQFLGHWRSFEILIFDPQRQQILKAVHPFRFFFQRLEVYDNRGQLLGAVQRRWAFFHKKFDVEDALGTVGMTVESPFWRIWTFRFMRAATELAVITKRWGGMLKEAFLDADSFQIEFKSQDLTQNERLVLVAAGVFVDLTYFEQKSNNNSLSAFSS